MINPQWTFLVLLPGNLVVNRNRGHCIARIKESPTWNKSKKEIRKQTDGAHNRRAASEVQQAEVPYYWKKTNISGRGSSGKKFSQGLFSSTLYPGTDLDNTERLEPSFLGVALLSLVFCLPWKESSWLSVAQSPSDTLPDELSYNKNTIAIFFIFWVDRQVSPMP